MTVMFKQTCSTCGRTALAHRGVLFDPVAQRLLTDDLDGGALAERSVYLAHQCQDQAIEAFQARVLEVSERLSALRQARDHGWSQEDLVDAQQLAQLDVQELAQLTAELALDQECPKCDVPMGSPCENLTERRRGRRAATKAPHAERIPPVDSADGYRLAALREQLADKQGLVHEIYRALETDRGLDKLITLARTHCPCPTKRGSST